MSSKLDYEWRENDDFARIWWKEKNKLFKKNKTTKVFFIFIPLFIILNSARHQL